jgi:transposase
LSLPCIRIFVSKLFWTFEKRNGRKKIFHSYNKQGLYQNLKQSFIKENSAICEITGYQKDKITKDKLYKISHSLYAVKDELESYLSKRTNELFDIEDKLIIYDLTNTYFEGQMRNSKLAKFGRSKEMRKDARLIVLGIVINREGFLKHSCIFEGNTADSKTLGTVVDSLSSQTSFTNRKPTVVIDAGIATDENLKMLKKKHYDYMCVSRSSLKEYYASSYLNSMYALPISDFISWPLV